MQQTVTTLRTYTSSSSQKKNPKSNVMSQIVFAPILNYNPALKLIEGPKYAVAPWLQWLSVICEDMWYDHFRRRWVGKPPVEFSPITPAAFDERNILINTHEPHNY